MRAAVVAPAVFGAAAAEYLDGAASVLGKHGRVSYGVIAHARELDQVLGPLEAGDIVLGSLGSELAAQVASQAVDRRLVHVEAGAIGDEALGANSFRLTAAKAELAHAAAELAAGRRVGLLAESSDFGRTVATALRDELARQGTATVVESDVEEVLVNPASWYDRFGVDTVLAAVRGSLPERLLAAIGRDGAGIELCIGAGGSWSRAEVGRAASDSQSCRVVFCEVLAPSATRRRRIIAGEPTGPRTLYGDLGVAAGMVIARVTQDPSRLAIDALRELVLDEDVSPLGYGVRFEAGGRNVLAKAALLQWNAGAMSSYYPGGRACVS